MQRAWRVAGRPTRLRAAPTGRLGQARRPVAPQSSPRAPGGPAARSSPRAGAADALHALQRAAGNRAVRRIAQAARRPQPAAPAGDGALGLRAGRGPGRPLEPAVRSLMEAAFGASLAGVRVHTGAHARQATRQLGGAAFTAGDDLFFAAGRYDPHSHGGRRLLAHELAHVLQQEHGRRRPDPLAATTPGDRYEREARRVADLVVGNGIGGGPIGPNRRDASMAGQARVRERWRGPAALLGRAAPPAAAATDPGLVAAGITEQQAHCIVRWQARAVAAAGQVRECCAVFCDLAAACRLPQLWTLPAEVLDGALDLLLGPGAWSDAREEARRLGCRGRSGQGCQACCREATETAATPLGEHRAAPAGRGR